MRRDRRNAPDKTLWNHYDGTVHYAGHRPLVDADAVACASSAAAYRQNACRKPAPRLLCDVPEGAAQSRVLRLKPLDVASEKRQRCDLSPEPHILGLRRGALEEPRHTSPYALGECALRALDWIDRLDRRGAPTDEDGSDCRRKCYRRI